MVSSRHVIAAVLFATLGCERKEAPPPETTAGWVQVAPDRAIVGRCDLPDTPGEAPKFELDSARLSAPGQRLMALLADCLVRGPLAGKRISITGYTDARGTSEYNRQLGLYRAIAAKLALTEHGVPETAIEVRSRGEQAAVGTSEPGFRLDRRVEIHVEEAPPAEESR